MNNLDLTISIASYNTSDLLTRCLNSIYKNTRNVNLEVIVVDNASSDGTKKMIKENFKKVKLIENKKNLFFTVANNQALKLAKGRYFLILNSDTYFVDNSIRKMIEKMDKNSRIGAVGGTEVYENGEIILTGSKFSSPLIDFYELSFIGKRFKNKKIINRFKMNRISRLSDFDVDMTSDAFLMVRTNILKELGGYDPKLLLYYTENDLCLRIKKKGFRILHMSEARVVHTVSASVKKIGWKKLDIYYHDLLHYYKKNGRPITGTMLYALLKMEKSVLKILRPDMFS